LQLKNKRKIQGTGKYFNSQMTFYVKSDISKFDAYHDPTKKQGLELYKLDKKQKNPEGEWKILSYIYKVKVFRNGKAQIPGLRTEFDKEAKQVLKPIINFFAKFFDKRVKATGFNKFIQNYKSCIVEDVQYEMDKLLKHFMALEQGAYPKDIRRLKASAHSKLLIYFNTSEKLPDGSPKLTNLTIYRKGSINVDGAISRESAEKILKYFKKILNKNPNLLYDPNISSSEDYSSESDTSSEESTESSSNSSWDE
jgi:TATA-box binding protein (TBP) (component of TFIID and TFIIIB)